MGYHWAGFDVTGVDKVPQPHYPFEFIPGDALAYLHSHADEIRETYSAIHASPPCQDYSTLTQGNRGRANWWDWHEDLIEATREGLKTIGLPWVLENVPASWIRPDMILCGEMFGLDVIRHRYFEFGNWTSPLPAPEHVPHRGKVRGWRHGVLVDGPYYAVHGQGGGKGTLAEWSKAMGIDWMTRAEIVEAIPPAYTEYVGGMLMGWMSRNPQR